MGCLQTQRNDDIQGRKFGESRANAEFRLYGGDTLLVSFRFGRKRTGLLSYCLPFPFALLISMFLSLPIVFIMIGAHVSCSLSLARNAPICIRKDGWYTRLTIYKFKNNSRHSSEAFEHPLYQWCAYYTALRCIRDLTLGQSEGALAVPTSGHIPKPVILRCEYAFDDWQW